MFFCKEKCLYLSTSDLIKGSSKEEKGMEANEFKGRTKWVLEG